MPEMKTTAVIGMSRTVAAIPFTYLDKEKPEEKTKLIQKRPCCSRQGLFLCAHYAIENFWFLGDHDVFAEEDVLDGVE